MDVIRRLARFARPYTVQLVLVSILSPASSLLFVGYFVILQSLIDGGILAKDLAVIRRDLLVLVALALAREGAGYVSGWIRTSLQERLHRDVQMSLFSRALRLPLGELSALPAGGLINKVVNESGAVSSLVTQWSVELLVEPVKAAGLLAALVCFDRKLAIMMAGVIVPVAILNKIIAGRLDRFYETYYDRKAAILARLEEVLSALPVVKAFVREREEERRFDRLLDSAIKTDLSLAGVSLLAQPLNEITKIVALAAVVLVGGGHVRAGAIDAGTLVVFIGTAVSLFGSIGSLSSVYAGLRNSIIGSRRVCEFLSGDEEGTDGGGAEDLPPGLRGRLELMDVTFSYPGRSPLFAGLRLDLDDGAFTAIVGESGSGKTTLAYLLTRFYCPQG
ncbi:MAG TPA: ABC transporter ATP-binding protein, partial [bacterium]|nr:ABC transporter ATP-binding protein [bacterium]